MVKMKLCYPIMVTIMDNLMDEWDFPQKGLEQREFIPKEHPAHKRKEVRKSKLEKF